MIHGRSARRLAVLVAVVGLSGLFWGQPWVRPAKSADHRESPLIAEDPAADLADVFIFVNPNDPSRVVMALTVNGFAVPGVRASYSFSNSVLYQFKIDNTGDAKEDLVVQVTFSGHEFFRDPRCATAAGGQFLSLGGGAPPSTGPDNVVFTPGVVTGCTNTIISRDIPGVGTVRVFAGLRDDPFVTDPGQLNRIIGGSQDVFRQVTSPVLGALRGRPIRTGGTFAGQDLTGTSGSDTFGGFNVSALLVEVPKSLIQGSTNRTGTYLKSNTTIGFWGTTGRQVGGTGPFLQVQRMGQTLIKTVFLGTNALNASRFPGVSLRDVFNRISPDQDSAGLGQFFPDALTTTDNDGTGNTIAGRAALLDALGVTTLPGGVPLLLPAGFQNTDKELLRKVLVPDVLRIDLALAPDDLGIAANGLQNGRRLGDDVTDILLRLARQLADVRFPPGSGVAGSGPAGTRQALDCTVLPGCPDRRVLAVLQGSDFIRPDSTLTDLSTSGNERPLLSDFPFFAEAHPLPGGATPAPGTVGYPPQQ